MKVAIYLMGKIFRRLCLAIALSLAAVAGTAAPTMAAETSGLPLPRFVSLRSDEVNLRSGPGKQYPVDWIYTRRELPVEVIAEFQDWRKVRDWQGAEGWLHLSMLSARRMMVVTGGRRRLRSEPDEKAASVAELEPNVVGKLLGCPRDKAYCHVEIDSLQGWLKRDEFWGVYPGEYIE
jgi:SH3-like domain-containing protein